MLAKQNHVAIGRVQSRQRIAFQEKRPARGIKAKIYPRAVTTAEQAKGFDRQLLDLGQRGGTEPRRHMILNLLAPIPLLPPNKRTVPVLVGGNFHDA